MKMFQLEETPENTTRRDRKAGSAMKMLQRMKARVLSVLLVPMLMVLSANATADTYYFHNDHLGTPQVLTDTTQQVVWKGEYDPFGKVIETVNIVEQNLRFPGQYLDRETGLHYNYFRTYDPNTGRYIESDPIGLQGGLSTYGYVWSNPLVNFDPNGLAGIALAPAAAEACLASGTCSVILGGGLAVGAACLFNPSLCSQVVEDFCSDISATFGGMFSDSTDDQPDDYDDQPDERDLTKLRERDGNRAAQDHGYDDAHDAKNGRGGGGVDIYRDKKTGKHWLWNGVRGGEKERV